MAVPASRFSEEDGVAFAAENPREMRNWNRCEEEGDAVRCTRPLGHSGVHACYSTRDGSPMGSFDQAAKYWVRGD